MSKYIVSRSYMFTSYLETLPEYDDELVRYLTFQGEICPTTNRKHWQGYVEFYKPCSIRRCQITLNIGNSHCDKRRGTREEARKYCQDRTKLTFDKIYEFGDFSAGGQGTRNDLKSLINKIEAGATDYELIKESPETVNKYMKFIKHTRHVLNEHKSEIYMKDNFSEVKLNDMQNEVIKHLDNQNDRQITWVFDSVGNTGKTFLAKHLIAKRGAIRFTNGRTQDISYAYKNNPIVVFDFARSCEERINYQIIEDLKNGMLFSSKYESSCKIFAPPKIVIMANFQPKLETLSADRWDIINLS